MLPLGDPGVPLDEALTYVRDWYAARDLPAYVQTATGAEGTQEVLCAELEARGWAREVSAGLWIGALAPLADREVAKAPGVVLARAADEAWLGRYQRKGLSEVALHVLGSGPSVWFATVPGAEGGPPAAIGRCVIDGRWAGFAAVRSTPPSVAGASPPPSWPRSPAVPWTRAPRRPGSRWRRTTRGRGRCTPGWASRRIARTTTTARPRHPPTTAVERREGVPDRHAFPIPEPERAAEVRRRFAEEARSEQPSLAALCLLIGAAADGTLDEAGTDAAQIELDRSGQLQFRPGGALSWATALAELLGGRCGFRGSPGDYQRLESSLLHAVLRAAARAAHPALRGVDGGGQTGRRARGLGVALPGHFVVGFGPAEQQVLADPFDGGGC